MYKTMAVERFMNDNYTQMFRVAACRIGESEASGIIHDTYVSLIEKEERGQRCFGLWDRV